MNTRLSLVARILGIVVFSTALGCAPARGVHPAAGGSERAQPTKNAASSAGRDETLRYEIVFGDRVAGHIVIVRHPDRSSDEELEFQERGKRPKTHARLELGADGLPDKLEIVGKNIKLREVHELCTCDRTHCRWHSSDERGEGPRGFYSPLNISLVSNAALLRRATQTGGAELLPGGVLRAREMSRVTLRKGNESFTVRAFEIAGFAFSPRIEWFDEAGETFAQVDDFGGAVREGWKHVMSELLELQRPLAGVRRERIAKEVSHRPETLAIVHARWFDPVGKKTTENTTVIVEGGKIARVGVKLPAPPGAEVIDASGKTLLPGLWDMHVHLQDDDGLMNIANGITSVRDLGSEMDSALARKARWDAGAEIGPRVLLAGFVDGHGPVQGPFKVFADTPDEAKKVVATYASRGYVQLKIYGSVKPELVPILIVEAKKHGLRVSGHVPQGMTSASAVRAGFQELQHIEQVMHDLHGTAEEERRKTSDLAERGADVDLNGPKTRALIDLFVKRHTVIDPTVNVLEGELTTRPDHPNPTLAPILTRLPAQVQRDAVGGALPVPDGRDARYRASFQRSLELVKLLWDRRVTLVAGSDAWPGFALHRELELYSEAGIPNADVLAIATLGAARVMKLDKQTGSIAPGKDADLVIVDGDPVKSMSDVRKIVTVVKGGTVIDAVAARRALSIAP